MRVRCAAADRESCPAGGTTGPPPSAAAAAGGGGAVAEALLPAPAPPGGEGGAERAASQTDRGAASVPANSDALPAAYVRPLFFQCFVVVVLVILSVQFSII